ncbi:MAG: hypothetical protein HGB30_15025 [Holophagaceae bacterium]|nr:hypothetical protein [Holophagaceae bacterium]
MQPVLTICADCERRALRRPRQGRAMTEALSCLTQLLLNRKRLQGLQIVREHCLLNCPLGRVCVTLKQGACESRHHLAAEDDLRAVARRLVGQPKATPGTT